MLTERMTLTEFIISEQRRSSGATGALTALLNCIRLACKRISWLVGEWAPGKGDAGEATQSMLDAVARETFRRTLSWSGSVAGMVCEEMEEPRCIIPAHPVGPYLVVFEPLVGFRDLDVNVDTGSIFSILRAPEFVAQPTTADFLRPGTRQVAAGYALYGPATLIVFTAGRGVNGFTLRRGFGEFFLTHPDLTIAPSTRELAVNTANARLWEPPVQRYVDECLEGAAGPRGVDFGLRWVASLVAGVHRVLLRGGVFIVPAELRRGPPEGQLRLLFEANPMAMLVAQAGGAASTGRGPLLEVVPSTLHERSPMLLGAREEVERLERYHREYDEGLDAEFFSPLFNERSLFPPRR
jgi:fructose-1,6-bisphosphatase